LSNEDNGLFALSGEKREDLSLRAQNFYVRKLQANIDNLRDIVGDIMSYYKNVYGDMSDSSYMELKVILNELLINAIKHGSKGDGDKFIKVIADLTADKYALLVVEDEGDGYDTSFIEQDEMVSYGYVSSYGSGGFGAVAPAAPASPVAPASSASSASSAQVRVAVMDDAQPASRTASPGSNAGAGAKADSDAGITVPDADADAGSDAGIAVSDADFSDGLFADALFAIEETGRGICIVRNLCDDFMVNSKGNKVVIKKRLRKY
jgi:anti-sigma regulatory factor (Ser/Thr protein kinase)